MTVLARTAANRGTGRGPRPSRQVRVSFSGLDGAGKTRQIDALVAAVGPEVSVEVLWIPFKVWPESLLNRLPAGFRARLGPKRVTAAQQPSGAGTGGGVGNGTSPPRSPLAGSTARTAGAIVWTVIATLAAVSAGLGLRRRARAASADLVILDRYRLDSLVKLQFWYGDVSPDWLTRVVTALAPAPDLELLLRVDPEVAYARKPEQWSVEQLSRQARRYERLARRLDQVVVLEGHEHPDELAHRVGSLVEAVRRGQ
jgi:thymidylate kinase